MSDPVLEPVFRPFFRGDEELGSGLMGRLTDALISNPTLAVGVIVDEVQAITNAVESDDSSAAKTFFQGTWYNWQGAGRPFVRMDIASSHGNKFLYLL